jgi:hypothetical protein
MQLFDKQSILFESCFPSGDLSRPIYYDWRRLSKPALRVSDRLEISVLIAIFLMHPDKQSKRSKRVCGLVVWCFASKQSFRRKDYAIVVKIRDLPWKQLR